ncbi:protein KASH5 isoform X2 [Crotalus tigris]|uniref:protein KASH5 isoform X2 n=1 Tax=Crotalus tigris TaxID=88082 RepID=UPI00192F7009|nr:protein KASH5 isoform X2 [Crotalus tigris]
MMDHSYNNTLENRAVVQLTAVLSTDTMPQDSIGISSKNIILNAGQYSEEHVLKCTFKACDPEKTGQVSVFHIIEYLQEMTGQSCEDWRLQSLYRRLDPEEQGLTVDFSTFYSVMKDWIADCQQEGEEATDLTNCIKDLHHNNKQLAMQNVKLQRTIEAAEELNSRLSEEISQLKEKLRGNQQTLEQAKVLANELEDLNFFSKSMEEENNRLHIQARQLEKEQQLLSVKMDNLQDENKKLLLEKESSEGKIKKLFTKKAKMKSQLSEYENRISCKDAALNKKTKQIEELTITLEEYQMMVQVMSPTDSLQNMNGSIQTSAQSLYKEIEESRRQEISRECGLRSPLCGMLNSLVKNPVAEGSIDSLTEQKHSKNESDDTKALLPVSHNMPQLSLATDGKLISKNQEHKQDRNHLLSEKGGSKEESKQSLTNEHTGNSKTLELTLKNMDVWTYPSDTETQMVHFSFQEIMVFSSVELCSEEALQKHPFVPKDGELIPNVWEKTNGHSCEILLQRFFDVPLGYLILHILQELLLLGLLLVLCVSLLAVFCLVIFYNQFSMWIEPEGKFWHFLSLQYRHLPPI